jgi:hypothetical protein
MGDGDPYILTMSPRLLLFLVLALLVSLPATADSFVVTSNADSGPGTLRQAILDANSGACQACHVTFAFSNELPPRPERLTIRIDLLSELPAITASGVHIRAAQYEFDLRTQVIVNGSRAGASAVGLRVNGVRGFEIVAVTFEHFAGGGGFIDRSSIVSIQAGGFNDSAANGLVIRDSDSIQLGSTTFLRNGGNGVFLQRSAAIVMTTCNIGVLVHPDSREAYPNDGNGVHLDSVIGGQIVGNAIQNNGGNGILVTGESIENSLEFNEMGNNAFLGIDLGGDGPTANDPLDADAGPNHLQNAPVIEAALFNRGALRVRGHLDAQPNTRYDISLWTAQPDPSGFGEGVRPILSSRPTVLTTDATGRAPFTIDFTSFFSGDLVAGTPITALASRLPTELARETSEFSRTVVVVEDAVTFEVTNTADSFDCTGTFVCEIAFRIATPPNGQGVWTIRPQSQLPPIARSGVWINGATQTVSAGDTNPAGPEIEINGAACGACNGIELRVIERDVELAVVRGVIVNGFSGHGIVAQGQPPTRYVSAPRIDASFIGTDATGTRAVPNGGSGIHVTDAHVSVGAVPDNRLHIDRPLGNVISGNRGDGITTIATTSYGAGVIAFGNAISTDSTRLYPLPNGGNGISSGGGDRVENNVIAFSTGTGVLVTGAPAVTGIINNSIHSNGGLGIDVRREGEQAAPVIESARFADGQTRVRYTLDAPPRNFPGWYWIDLSVASFTDFSGNGEGRRIVRNALISNRETTPHEFVIDENLTGKFGSMTATPFDTFYYAPNGTTSEFSRSVQVTAAGCDEANATLDFPADGASLGGPTTFRWSAVPGAIVYRLWVMQPGGPVTLAFEGPAPAATLSLAPGTYEWWVETRFACYGPQTEHRRVTVQ